MTKYNNHFFHFKTIYYVSKKNVKFSFVDNLHDICPGEYMNEALTGDDEGYYNTAEFNTSIRFEDLQRVISDKSAGENNTFQSEYKVLHSSALQYITLPTT